MHADVDLSMGQQFEIERFNRAIDATTDADQLRLLAKQLLQAWLVCSTARGLCAKV